MTDESVSLSLLLVGSDEEPRWAALVKYYPMAYFNSDGQYCCTDGHWTPEAAAAHGLEIATARLVAAVRALEPPAVGALALQRAAA